eukprot:TRINITY_DN2466_c0_g1_i4.p3 TRINITY_DN2466_c0_g1~~TRINITY_DN2466_c0_g1_i4.p3  ORF type:complete len:304 (+),score=-8.12 TRINITY_DN2466_c0_g1_i4:351-1262(+)
MCAYVHVKLCVFPSSVRLICFIDIQANIINRLQISQLVLIRFLCETFRGFVFSMLGQCWQEQIQLVCRFFLVIFLISSICSKLYFLDQEMLENCLCCQKIYYKYKYIKIKKMNQLEPCFYNQILFVFNLQVKKYLFIYIYIIIYLYIQIQICKQNFVYLLQIKVESWYILLINTILQQIIKQNIIILQMCKYQYQYQFFVHVLMTFFFLFFLFWAIFQTEIKKINQIIFGQIYSVRKHKKQLQLQYINIQNNIQSNWDNIQFQTKIILDGYIQQNYNYNFRVFQILNCILYLKLGVCKDGRKS